MAIDLEKGISLKIEGELGKNQTLPVDAMIGISASLQELVLAIAKFDLPAEEALDLNNFKLEFSDFQKGSAIPSYVLSPVGQTSIVDAHKQRDEVSIRFSKLLEIADQGNYNILKDIFPEPKKRNALVETLYNFTHSFKESPVSIYARGNSNEEGAYYRPKKFKSSVKKQLIGIIKEEKKEKEEEQALALVKVVKSGGKTTNRIIELVSTEKHSLSYSPEVINIHEKQYLLNYPLRCLFEKEEDYYVIHNEQLNLIGTGMTREEAETNFNEEFDYLYTRLNSLEDQELGLKLRKVKNTINNFVKQVY